MEEDRLIWEIERELDDTGFVSFGEMAEFCEGIARGYKGKSPHVYAKMMGVSRTFRRLHKRKGRFDDAPPRKG